MLIRPVVKDILKPELVGYIVHVLHQVVCALGTFYCAEDMELGIVCRWLGWYQVAELGRQSENLFCRELRRGFGGRGLGVVIFWCGFLLNVFESGEVLGGEVLVEWRGIGEEVELDVLVLRRWGPLKVVHDGNDRLRAPPCTLR